MSEPHAGPAAPDGQDLSSLPWRTGRHVGRTVYAVTGPDASRSDLLIGVMDTPELAAEACAAHNAALSSRS